MIPRAHVDVWTADPAAFSGLPSGREVRSGYLDGNREFEPAITESDWNDAVEALEVEAARIAAAGAGAATPAAFEELADGDLEDWEMIAVQWLDVGVAAAVMALNAAGCLTSTSCRGHQGLASADRDYPRIRVYAERAHGSLVRDAAIATGCGLDIDGDGIGLLWAPSVVETMGLARELIAMRPRFESLGAGSMRGASRHTARQPRVRKEEM